MTTPEVLLFDVMDTLVVEPYWTALPAFFGTDLPGLQARQHPTSWVEFEHGRIDEAEYLRTFFRDGSPVDGAGLRAALRENYRWVPGMDELLPRIAARGLPIHALSNYPVWYRLIEERLELSRWLEWTFVSCDTGLRKPDPRSFRQVPERLGVAADACLFIDDRQGNVDAARACGLDAVHFTDAAALSEALRVRGVLPPA